MTGDPVLQDNLLIGPALASSCSCPSRASSCSPCSATGSRRTRRRRGAALPGLRHRARLLRPLGRGRSLRLCGPAAGDHEGLRFAQPLPRQFEWIEAGGFRVPFSLLLDPLSAVMILVVTGVGSLIHIYSLGYMAHDEDRVRYFSYLNLFTFFMLLLVLGGNLPLHVRGLGGRGLCSYLLIGFWFKKKSASDAGKKAFIVNRIGDAGLILGMILAFHAFGSLDLVDIADNAGALAQRGPRAVRGRSRSPACCSSSAPAARARRSRSTSGCPTRWRARRPVSRPDPRRHHGHRRRLPGGAPGAALSRSPRPRWLVVAVVGRRDGAHGRDRSPSSRPTSRRCWPTPPSASSATCSWPAAWAPSASAVFHLFTHAFFKALLFLGSGSVIHAMSGEQDMRQDGRAAHEDPVDLLDLR